MTKSILDRSFRYTPAASTDLRKTFAKARKLLAEQAAKQVESKVAPLKREVIASLHRRKS